MNSYNQTATTTEKAPTVMFDPNQGLLELDLGSFQTMVGWSDNSEYREALCGAGVFVDNDKPHAFVQQIIKPILNPLCEAEVIVAGGDGVAVNRVWVDDTMAVTLAAYSEDVFKVLVSDSSELPAVIARLARLRPRPHIDDKPYQLPVETVQQLFNPDDQQRKTAAYSVSKTVPASWPVAWSASWSEIGWRAVSCRTVWCSKQPGAAVHDDLVKRNFTTRAPNRVWVGDITEHPTSEGKLYMCSFKDLWSNRLVGYSIGPPMTADLAVAALQNAVTQRPGSTGVIVHTDRLNLGNTRQKTSLEPVNCSVFANRPVKLVCAGTTPEPNRSSLP